MVSNIFNYYTRYFSEPNILGQIGNFSSRIGKKTYFLALGMGPNFGPKFRRSRALKGYVFNSVNAVKELLSFRKIPPFNNFVIFNTSRVPTAF